MTAKSGIDAIDRAIVRATQAGLPLVVEPYARVAEEVGVSAEEVISRLRRMLCDRVIRRIGVVPNHYALGLTVNAMTVWDVADDSIDALGEQIGALDCVSHSYRRPRRLPAWPYNLFAMVHGKSQAEVTSKIETIARLLGAACRARDVLVSTRILKKTGLRLGA